MRFTVSSTPPGTRCWPQHFHEYWEVMCYTEGSGGMRVGTRRIPFSPGTVIVVPPKVRHGSESADGFGNISIGVELDGKFAFPEVVSFFEGIDGDAHRIAGLLLCNGGRDAAYCEALIGALAEYILTRVHGGADNGNAVAAVTKIRETMARSFSDPSLDVTALLASSGYAEDYVRAKFREICGVSPVACLTRLRIGEAQRMIEIYGGEISVRRLAGLCGFSDEVYFSKQFKRFSGVSPAEACKKRRTE